MQIFVSRFFIRLSTFVLIDNFMKTPEFHAIKFVRYCKNTRKESKLINIVRLCQNYGNSITVTRFR